MYLRERLNRSFPTNSETPNTLASPATAIIQTNQTVHIYIYIHIYINIYIYAFPSLATPVDDNDDDDGEDDDGDDGEGGDDDNKPKGLIQNEPKRDGLNHDG